MKKQIIIVVLLVIGCAFLGFGLTVHTAKAEAPTEAPTEATTEAEKTSINTTEAEVIAKVLEAEKTTAEATTEAETPTEENGSNNGYIVGGWSAERVILEDTNIPEIDYLNIIDKYEEGNWFAYYVVGAGDCWVVTIKNCSVDICVQLN